MAPYYPSPVAMFAAAMTGAMVGSLVTDMYLRDHYYQRQQMQAAYMAQQAEVAAYRAQLAAQQGVPVDNSANIVQDQRLAELEAKMAQLQGQVAAQDAKIAEQKQEIAQGKVDLSAVQQKVQLLEADVKLLEQQRVEGMQALAEGKSWDIDELKDNGQLAKHAFTVGDDPIEAINDDTGGKCTLTSGDIFRFAAGEKPSLHPAHLQIIFSKDEDCPIGSKAILAAKDEETSKTVLQGLINDFLEDLEVESKKLAENATGQQQQPAVAPQ